VNVSDGIKLVITNDGLGGPAVEAITNLARRGRDLMGWSPMAGWSRAVRHKIIKSGLLALCGLALLVQHVFDRAPEAGNHLVAGALMLTAAVIVWYLPSEPV